MERYNCPLLKKEIRDDECYDINSVVFKFCKPDLIKYNVDRERDAPICKACEHLQFKS